MEEGGEAPEEGETPTQLVKTYTWSDAAAAPTALMLALTRDAKFETASDEGSGAPGSVTATLTDQYGDPIRGRSISFTSDTTCTPGEGETTCDPPGLGMTGLSATTRRNGQAVRGYNYDSDESAIETISASLSRAAGEFGMRGDCVDGTEDDPATMDADEGCAETDDVPQVLEADKSVEFYWVGDVIDAPFTGRLLVKDTDNDQVVMEANDRVMLVKYDANDQFNDLDGVPVVMADFEKPLLDNADPAAGQLQVDSYESEAGKVSTFTLLPPAPPIMNYGGAGYILSPDAQSGTTSTERPMAADGGVLVVGAPYETYDCDHDNDGGASTPVQECMSAGAVYIYPMGTSTEADDIVRLEPPYQLAEGYFGWDVDIAGDLIVVGSARLGSVGNNRVYVYERPSGGVWTNTPRATFTTVASPVDSGTGVSGYTGGFGEGVAISGDGNTIAVVTPIGGVRVYTKTASAMWADDDNSANNPLLRGGGGEGVGWTNARSVAINGDGSVIVAGGCNVRSNPDNRCQGWAYVYERGAGAWGNHTDGTGRLWPNGGINAGSTSTLAHEYAKNVAVSADGNTVVLSGAYAESGTGTTVRGVAYVYERQAAGWNASHIDTIGTGGARTNINQPIGYELIAPDSAAGDRFGQYVAISADGSKIAISHMSQSADVGGMPNNRGAVLVFEEPDGGWPDFTGVLTTRTGSEPTTTFVGPYDGARFGLEVTYDKSNDALYAAASVVEDGSFEKEGVDSVSGDSLPIWGLAS